MELAPRGAAVVVGTAIATLVAAPAAVAQEPTTVVRTALEREVRHPCTGEDVVVSGTLTTVYRGDSEDFPRVYRSNFQGTAVGEVSGTSYRFVSSTMDPGTTNFTNGALESTDVLSYRFIGHGAAEDSFIRIVHHTTVSATGELTANPLEIRVHCPASPEG